MHDTLLAAQAGPYALRVARRFKFKLLGLEHAIYSCFVSDRVRLYVYSINRLSES